MRTRLQYQQQDITKKLDKWSEDSGRSAHSLFLSLFLELMLCILLQVSELRAAKAKDQGFMDGQTEHPHSTLNSFHCTGEISTTSADLNKKRKLQYEADNLGLPSPKQKYRDRSSSTLISESSENEGNSMEELTRREICDRLAQPEGSDNDSSSSVGVDDNTMMLDVQGKSEKSFLQNFEQSQPSISSNNNYNVSENNLNSLNGRIIKKTNEGPADLEDTLQYEQSDEFIGDECPGLGAYGDCIDSRVEEMEFSDAVTDDIMLSPNDVTPNAFLVSSGNRSRGQDARLGSRKPTIDQEFEQYFSMLML